MKRKAKFLFICCCVITALSSTMSCDDGLDVTQEYPFTVEGEDVRALIQMTPYYYRTAAEAVDRVSAEKELTTELAFRIDVFVKA